MSANPIGSLALKIITDADDMTRGLEGAQGMVEATSKRMEQALGVSANAARLPAAAFQDVGKVLDGLFGKARSNSLVPRDAVAELGRLRSQFAAIGGAGLDGIIRQTEKLANQIRFGNISAADYAPRLAALKESAARALNVPLTVDDRSFVQRITATIRGVPANVWAGLRPPQLKADAGFATQAAAWAVRPFTLGLSALQTFQAGLTGLTRTFNGLLGGLAQLPIIGGFFGALSHAFDFFTAADSKFSEIARVGKLSDRLGIDTKLIAGLQYANVGLDELERAGRGLQRSLAGLKLAGEDLEGTTSKLEHFGLSTEHLIRSGTQEAILEIADAYKRMEDPVRRSQLAQAAFGRSARDAEKWLRLGREGIMASVDAAEKLGLAYSRADAEKVIQGQRAIKEISKVFEGIKTQFAIGIAPYIGAVAKWLADGVKDGEGFAQAMRKVGDFAGNALLLMVEGIEAVIEAVNLAIHAFKAMGRTSGTGSSWNPFDFGAPARNAGMAAFQAREAPLPTPSPLLGDAKKGIRDLLRLNDELAEKAQRDAEAARKNFGLHILTEGIQAAAVELDKYIAKQHEAVNGFGIEKHSAELERLREQVAKLEQAKPVNLFGNAKDEAAARADFLRSHQRLINVPFAAQHFADSVQSLEILRGYAALRDAAELEMKKQRQWEREAPGLRRMLAEAEALDRQLKGLETWKKAMEDVKKIQEHALKPLEKLDKTLDHLSLLFRAGALDWETYQKAASHAGKEAAEALHKHEPVHPKAIVAGTAEAFSFQLKANERGRANPNAGVEARLERLKDQAEISNVILRGIDKALALQALDKL